MKNAQVNRWLDFNKKRRLIEDKLDEQLAIQAHKLSLNEFYALYFLGLKDDEKLRLQELQAQVGLSQSAMSRLVVRLERPECGAIERTTCEDDKRGVYIHLTKVGEDVLKSTLPNIEPIIKENL
ncbi:MarR family winged helix-turn-helix transcriptional regulator [Companilactobacillus mishanensis]|uniref:MarR family transcriptional regulator n=1 Tax=Companilactobacillus mishanensis TaxID=2486008 RepID=A0A5P0ZLG5_9LACO|nr:MarR family transcriptional regulator [Companilactobacillus mishanensis]MQS53507.1 MarR family transcriptional regulator [Companilactobacillus mishanensis]